jgi:hypothetical protein
VVGTGYAEPSGSSSSLVEANAVWSKEIASPEKKINDTLESSIGRVPGEGAKRIGADMGAQIAANAAEALESFGGYRSARGQVLLACVMCLVAAISYWFGVAWVLGSAPQGVLENILLRTS